MSDGAAEYEMQQAARANRYGKWAGNERGVAYVEGRCAQAVYGGRFISYQCSRPNGHGVAGSSRGSRAAQGEE